MGSSLFGCAPTSDSKIIKIIAISRLDMLKKVDLIGFPKSEMTKGIPMDAVGM